MSRRAIEFLKEHESASPARFVDEARWLKENAGWLLWSRNIVLSLVDYMQTHNLTRAGLAAELGVSPQYVSKLLSGKVNFSFKSAFEIQSRLGLNCVSVAIAP